MTVDFFAQTINRLKGNVRMIFITHQVPKGLQVDEVVNMGQQIMQMSFVKEENKCVSFLRQSARRC